MKEIQYFQNTPDDWIMRVHLSTEILESVQGEVEKWVKENKVKRLWDKDASLWTNNDEGNWLGWLTIPKEERHELPDIEKLQEHINSRDIRDVVILGMGGSSLCPAMLASTFGKIGHNPRLHVLDSTDPLQIIHLEKILELTKTLFIVSSKSGGTLEPNIFMKYFYARLQKELDRVEVSDHFAAITDPGTKLEEIAQKNYFAGIFFGLPSIGGRYSALSNFGMVPAKIMGLEVDQLLAEAEKMMDASQEYNIVEKNPGVLLGIILGVCYRFNKDKITFVISPGIEALGAWLEQLLAESTGKLGKALIPVDGEPLGKPSDYGNDRVFVVISLDSGLDSDRKDNDGIGEFNDRLTELKLAGQVMIQLKLKSKYQISREWYRWEMATAVAGSLMGINPFNQPDVEDSKILAIQLVQDYQKTDLIPKPPLLIAEKDIQLFADNHYAQKILKLIENKPKTLETLLKAHFADIKSNDYINISAFIEMSDEHLALLQAIRTLLRNDKRAATCLGFGPRFLHSTGQAYKGGPNTGVFLQITADHEQDITVPGENYSFGLVIDAQAEADFQVLAERGRRLMRLHLGANIDQGLKTIYQLLK